MLPVHPVFTLSYRHLSAASGIFRLLRNICLGHVYTWMCREVTVLFFSAFPYICGRKRVLFHYEFYDETAPSFLKRLNMQVRGVP